MKNDTEVRWKGKLWDEKSDVLKENLELITLKDNKRKKF